jgi:peptidoglycan/xylan/chitin deacetylase (PgdA/CDA1 family)
MWLACVVDARELHARRRAKEQERLRYRRRAALIAFAALVVIVGVAAAGLPGGGRKTAGRAPARSHVATGRDAARPPSHGRAKAAEPSSVAPAGATQRRVDAVPILMYHVIAPPPPGASFPGLYVAPAQFRAQMRALERAGWHGVTMDQVLAHWRRGTPLGPGRPIVLTFDNGYRSQYTKAMPVLRALGWAGVENIQLTGLPPSQGGLTRRQVRGLLDAGWELDTQGLSHADLGRLGAAARHAEIADARRILRQRYGVPVNWFCYPSGQYDATVIAAVRRAGYVGSTTVVPGWARRTGNTYRLPRLRVLGGTSGPALLGLIARARAQPPPPPAYRSS